MRRRNLLTGTTGAVCGLAGCTGSTFDRLRTTRPGTDDDDTGTDASDETDREAAESESDDAITVGDPDDAPFLGAHPPHELTLRNEGESDRTVSVTITTDQVSGDDGAGSGDDALLERDFDLSAREELVITLVEPRSYAITVTTGDDGTSESTVTDGVSRRPFDCLRSRTTITLRGTDVETASSSTTIPCPDPDVVDASLAVGEGQCAGRTDRERATVEFTGESVVIAGALGTPTPCHDLSLAEPTYDADRDLLAVTVAVGTQAAANCIDCLGIVGYDARIDLEGRYPDTVAVRHRRRDETRRITTAESPAGE
ncbi:hypothetical protein [Natrinema altunense]|uniref:Uncharacterized protein n=1 Tax=Natrinema altunense TaxID=222984 RepID=A0A482XW34_9EURY|nr:hypothetical protein [Natrinema altunense]RZH66590.1 hypothetical protein ELS17_16145 [Natrinema altunense]